MVNGFHALLYSRDAPALRAFFRDVLELPHVDSGEGWLIFGLPPAELGCHPSDSDHAPELYLMCEDVDAAVDELKRRGAEFAHPVTDAGFGRVTSIKLPGGGEIGLYEPKHPTATHLRP